MVPLMNAFKAYANRLFHTNFIKNCKKKISYFFFFNKIFLKILYKLMSLGHLLAFP